jgi:hypothetical protein
MIALVRRGRRRQHLASLHGDVWIPVCDVVDVPAAGAIVVELEQALGTIDDEHGQLCTHCHRLILMAAYAGRDRVARLVASFELVA